MKRPSAQTEGRQWEIRAWQRWHTAARPVLNKCDPREGSGHRLGAGGTQDGLPKQGNSGAEVGQLEDSEQSDGIGVTGHQLRLIVRMESSTIAAPMAAPLLSVPGYQGAKGLDIPGNGHFGRCPRKMLHLSCSRDTCVLRPLSPSVRAWALHSFFHTQTENWSLPWGKWNPSNTCEHFKYWHTSYVKGDFLTKG